MQLLKRNDRTDRVLFIFVGLFIKGVLHNESKFCNDGMNIQMCLS